MKKLPKFTCRVSDCADYRKCQRRRVIVRPCGRSNPALGDLTPAPFKFRESRQTDGDGPANGQRAKWANCGVVGFLLASGELEPIRIDEDSVRDLLADLGHLCDREGLDFPAIVNAAKRDWRAER